MDSRALGFAALITLVAGAGAVAQIPEHTSFQPSTYGGAGAPGKAPVYYQSRFVPYAASAMVAQARSEDGNVNDAAGEEPAAESEGTAVEATAVDGQTGERGGNFKPLDGANFGEAWQKKFPETPDVPQVPVAGVPAMVDVVAPIPYLAYHTTLDGRTRIVPYGPAYVFAPEQLPLPTSHWKRFWSSFPSTKQDMPQVWNLGYYDPMPPIMESEPQWWKRTLGYPRPIWGPMPAASWLGGLPAARLAKTTMHFYEGNYAEDYAVWMASQSKGKTCPVHGHSHPAHGNGHRHGPNGACPIHGKHVQGQIPTRVKPHPDVTTRTATSGNATMSKPMPVVEAEADTETVE